MPLLYVVRKSRPSIIPILTRNIGNQINWKQIRDIGKVRLEIVSLYFKSLIWLCPLIPHMDSECVVTDMPVE